MESVNYWLIEMNPENWDVSKCAIGFRQTIDSRNKAGALKPRLGEMKTGELVLVYEASVNKAITRVLVVDSPREMVNDDVCRDVVVKIIAEIPAVTLDDLKEKMPDLYTRIASPIAIHCLTAEDFHGVMKLAYNKSFLRRSAMKNTRTVKLKVWTNDLGLLQITPVSRKYAYECLRECAHGNFDLDDPPQELFDEFSYYQPIYFCDGSDSVRLTVIDGEEKQTYEELPIIDYGFALELNYECETIEDVIDIYGDNEDYIQQWKWVLDVEKYISRTRETVDLYVGKSQLDIFLNTLENHLDFSDYIMEVTESCNECSEVTDSEKGVNYIECGSIGKSIVSFNIEIPKDETFDIHKLHFVYRSEWWDVEEFDFSDIFYEKHIMLMFVEYDGCFYPFEEVETIQGWKYHIGFFSDNNYCRLEYDEEEDEYDEEDDDDAE